EYSHPGRPHGLPLPEIIYNSIVLTALEENKSWCAFLKPFHKCSSKGKCHPF
ncbi:hypothetical protein PAXRUDRAFT_135068, partial [Paxillus rubicundulus Ve08.2h10]